MHTSCQGALGCVHQDQGHPVLQHLPTPVCAALYADATLAREVLDDLACMSQAQAYLPLRLYQYLSPGQLSRQQTFSDVALGTGRMSSVQDSQMLAFLNATRGQMLFPWNMPAIDA